MAQDSHANIFLKQALGNDLLPINFEIKQRNKQQMAEATAKARLNGNLTTINGTHHDESAQGLVMKARQEKQLKSSSNPSLRPVKNHATGKSGASINAELAKHSISVS